MTYLFIYKRIRFEQPCPDCIQYYISIHKTLDDIKNCIIKNYNDLDENNIKILLDKKSLSMQTDDSNDNFDDFNIITIVPNETYNLQYTYYQLHKQQYLNNDFTHLFLHIHMDKTKPCASNINYNISYHTSYELAFESSYRYFYDNTDINIFECTNKNTISNKDNSKDYYNILKIENNNIMHLNAYCKY